MTRRAGQMAQEDTIESRCRPARTRNLPRNIPSLFGLSEGRFNLIEDF
jgi:hypothetical protein